MIFHQLSRFYLKQPQRKWNAPSNIYRSLGCFGYDKFASGMYLTAWA
jgi:hypothetical protein